MWKCQVRPCKVPGEDAVMKATKLERRQRGESMMHVSVLTHAALVRMTEQRGKSWSNAHVLRDCVVTGTPTQTEPILDECVVIMIPTQTEPILDECVVIVTPTQTEPILDECAVIVAPTQTKPILDECVVTVTPTWTEQWAYSAVPPHPSWLWVTVILTQTEPILHDCVVTVTSHRQSNELILQQRPILREVRLYGSLWFH